MAFNVRAFGYRGMRQLPNMDNKQFTGDTVYALEEPYEWSQVLNVNGDVMTPFVGPGSAADKSNILRIEVPAGSAVRYEINPPGRNIAAGNASPLLTQSDVFPWSVGYTLSLVDAAGYP